MPQKKNPDAYELMRGKSGRLIGDLNAAAHHPQRPTSWLLQRSTGGQRTTLRRGRRRPRDARRTSGDAPYGSLRRRQDGCGPPGGSRWRRSSPTSLRGRGVPFREAHHAVGGWSGGAKSSGCRWRRRRQKNWRRHTPRSRNSRETYAAGSVSNKKSPGSTSPESVEAQLAAARRFLDDERPGERPGRGFPPDPVGYIMRRVDTPSGGQRECE